MDIADCRVLIIDDHSLMRRMVSSELHKMGAINIDEASDGNLALQKIKTATQEGKPYNVAFLDWTMPQKNGFEVLTECRADETLNGMAIVMLSSESEEDNIIKALNAGATAYMTKPFKPGDISNKMKDVLNWTNQNKGGSVG